MSDEIGPVSRAQGTDDGRRFNQPMLEWMRAVKASVSSAWTSITTLIADLDSLATDVAGVEADITTIQGDITTIEAEIAALSFTKTSVYTTTGAGTHTWDTNAVGAWVTLVAGGGCGCGTQSGVANFSRAKGGGSGGQIKRIYVPRLSATTTAYSVGIGGVAGTGNAAGSSGGDTSFGNYLAHGGIAAPVNTGVGAAGPTDDALTGPTGGANATPGGPGISAQAISNFGDQGPSGGGGGTATTNTTGGKGGTSATGQAGGAGGAGAATPAAGGGGGGGGYNDVGGAGGNANTAGNDGVGYGAGGGGAGERSSGGPYNGGNGKQGIIIVEEVLE